MLKVLASYEYFSLSRSLALYFSEDFGYSDVQASERLLLQAAGARPDDMQPGGVRRLAACDAALLLPFDRSTAPSTQAGTIYGLWGTVLTLYGFLLGGTIDMLGGC